MRRWAAIAGFVFVVLAVVSRAVRGNIPDPGSNKVDALAKYTKFYADKSHSSHALVALVLGFVGLFAFAWFLGAVWSTLRNAEGGATMPTIIVAIGGAAFIALGLAEHAFADVMGITLHFSKGFREGGGFNAGTALLFNSLSFGIFMAAMLAIGAATAAAGIVILRTRVWPVWLGWVGIAIAVLCLPVIPPLSLLGGLLLAVWTVAIGILLIRADLRESAAA